MPDNIVNIDFHRHFRIEPGERVFDLGCGNGRHTIEAARYPGRVVGLDFSRDDLVAAKFMYDDLKRKGQAEGVADFIVGDAENLPFRDGAFDRSICTEVFEHIPQDERGIEEFLRVTKPGAPVAVSVPHYGPEAVFWKLSWDYWHTPGGHVRKYRPGQMRQMLERRDMEVQLQRSRHSFQAAYWFLRCIFGLNNENALPSKTFFRFINWHHARRLKPLEYIEAAANLVMGKDMILYGRKRMPGERPAVPAVLRTAAHNGGGAMTTTLDRFQSIDPALLDIGATDRVIDLGCGTGRHVLELSKAPANVIGADLSSHDLRVGRYLLEIMRRRGEVKARVHWMQAAGERLPFVDGAFDRVICTETLEHVDDDGALARELVRVLKPRGILAVSVPDEFSERLFWKLSENYRTHVGGHVRVYRRNEIVGLLRDAGLRPYAVRYRHSLESLYWLSHVAFWSEWGKQGPITGAFRRALDSERSRRSPIVTAIDDLGNRILPKSIVVYSRKPLRTDSEAAAEGDTPAPVTLEDETPHEFGVPEHLAPLLDDDVPVPPPQPDAETVYREAIEAAGDLPGANGHAGPREAEDDRTTVEVRAVPAPFAVEPPPVKQTADARAALSLRDELRIAITLDGRAQKDRLVEILRSCRFRLMSQVQELDGEQASAPWTEDGRSLKEIVGHITGWERWVTAGLEEIIAGETEPGIMSLSAYPIGIARYASIDAFNAARMAEARETLWSTVLAESDAVFERLIARVEEVPAEALAATSPFFWPDLGGTVPCGVYLLMTSAHHYQEEHLSDVARS